MPEIKPNFIEIRSFGARISSNYIGITKNGNITFYSGFYKRNNIDKFSNCLILLDKHQEILGIQFGHEGLGKGSFRINHNKDRGTANISASNVFRMNKLNISEWRGKYEPKEYKDEVRKNVFIMYKSEKKNTNKK